MLWLSGDVVFCKTLLFMTSHTTRRCCTSLALVLASLFCVCLGSSFTHHFLFKHICTGHVQRGWHSRYSYGMAICTRTLRTRTLHTVFLPYATLNMRVYMYGSLCTALTLMLSWTDVDTLVHWRSCTLLLTLIHSAVLTYMYMCSCTDVDALHDARTVRHLCCRCAQCFRPFPEGVFYEVSHCNLYIIKLTRVTSCVIPFGVMRLKPTCTCSSNQCIWCCCQTYVTSGTRWRDVRPTPMQSLFRLVDFSSKAGNIASRISTSYSHLAVDDAVSIRTLLVMKE